MTDIAQCKGCSMLIDITTSGDLLDGVRVMLCPCTGREFNHSEKWELVGEGEQ